MNFLYWISILLLPLVFSYRHRYSNGLNDVVHMYMKQREANLDEINKKFGSPRYHMLRFMPIDHQQQLVQNLPCVPQIWTCGPGLPDCCPGLMCFEGNAKRGRHCVAKG